jgi:hypothetical protein
MNKYELYVKIFSLTLSLLPLIVDADDDGEMDPLCLSLYIRGYPLD